MYTLVINQNSFNLVFKTLSSASKSAGDYVPSICCSTQNSVL